MSSCVPQVREESSEVGQLCCSPCTLFCVFFIKWHNLRWRTYRLCQRHCDIISQLKFKSLDPHPLNHTVARHTPVSSQCIACCVRFVQNLLGTLQPFQGASVHDCRRVSSFFLDVVLWLCCGEYTHKTLFLWANKENWVAVLRRSVSEWHGGRQNASGQTGRDACIPSGLAEVWNSWGVSLFDVSRR